MTSNSCLSLTERLKISKNGKTMMSFIIWGKCIVLFKMSAIVWILGLMLYSLFTSFLRTMLSKDEEAVLCPCSAGMSEFVNERAS